MENVKKIMAFRADQAYLEVTADHHVMVRRGGQHVRAPADSLRQGDDVLCSSGVHSIESICSRAEIVDIVKIRFQPDVDIETFFVPDAIKTYGQKQKSTRSYRRNPTFPPSPNASLC